MGIPDNNLARTRDVLLGIQSRLAAVQWTPAVGGPVAAFAKVEIYDLRELLTAMKELLGLADRVALVVYENGEFETVQRGREEYARETRRVAILVADRNWGDRRKGWMGDDQAPGAYALADLVVESLRGQLGELPVWLRPTRVEPMMISGSERQNLVGRGVMIVSLDVVGGEIQTDLGNRTY
jgi:hypothetical protein